MHDPSSVAGINPQAGERRRSVPARRSPFADLSATPNRFILMNHRRHMYVARQQRT
jgi:hypothetical protein